MARFPFLSVQTLRENYPDEPFFLDPFKIERFLDFLAIEPQLSEAARERRWKIVVFKSFLDDLPKARQTLAKQLFEVETLQVRREENWMVNELLSLIFRGDVSQQARAELLVLARRRQRGGKVLLLSNSEHLSTLPNAQAFYFCGAAQIEEIRDLPIDFNLVQDLKLHARLVAAARKWEIGESANAVLEAMNALSSDCRIASGLTSDGVTLMQAAFGHQGNGAEGCVQLKEALKKWVQQRILELVFVERCINGLCAFCLC